MVIDEKTVQVNSFTKGMNTDMSDSLILDSQYRFARNVRYVTNQESTSGELHIIEGAQPVVVLPSEITEIIETTQLRDLGIVIALTTFGWGVYTIDTNLERYKIERVYATYDRSRVATDQHVKSLGGRKRLSLVTRFEDKWNLKLYIADGHGTLLLVKLSYKEGQNPYITQIDETVAAIGERGEVDEGASLKTSNPETRFHKIKFCGLQNGGNIDATVVQYTYNFYSKFAAESNFSPFTKMIPLYENGPDSAAKDILGIVEKRDDSGTTVSENGGGKSVVLRIPIDPGNKYQIINVWRFRYKNNGETPIPELFFRREITPGEEIEIIDTGSQTLEEVTLEDFNMKTGLQIVPKTIESKGDWMFAADFSTREDALINDIDERIISGEYNFRTVSYNRFGKPQPSNNPYININKYYRNAEELAYIFESSDSNILGGSSNVLSWRFITTEVAIDDNTNKYSIRKGLNTYNSTSCKKNYIQYDESTSTFKYIESGTMDLSDFILPLYDNKNYYSNPTVSYQFKSLRRDEIYRFGIILYDRYGNRTPVEFVQDIRTPNAAQCKIFDTVGNSTYVYPLGIEFTINLGEQNKYYAYEIVRCKRGDSDMCTVALCVISRPIENKIYNGRGVDKENKAIYPTGLLTVLDYYINSGRLDEGYTRDMQRTSANFTPKSYPYWNPFVNVIDRIKLLQLICPELCYNDATFSGNYNLQIVDYITPLDYSFDTSNSIPSNTVTSGVSDFKINWGKVTGLNIPIASPNDESTDCVIAVDNRHFNTEFNYCVSAEYYNRKSGLHMNTQSYSAMAYIKLYEHGINNTSYDSIQQKLESDVVYKLDNLNKATDFYYDSPFNDGGSPYDVTTGFDNWVFGSSSVIPLDDYLKWGYDDEWTWDDYCGDKDVTGPGGTCAYGNISASKLKDMMIFHPEQVSKGNSKYPGTYICNIRKTGISPYGGSSDSALTTMTWRGYGDYFNIGSGFSNTSYIFNGDCTIQPFEYVSLHKWESPDEKEEMHNRPEGRVLEYCIVYSIPLETAINLSYTSGFEVSKHSGDVDLQSISWILKMAVDTSLFGGFNQEDNLYKYNTVYSAEPTSYTPVSSSRNGDDGTIDSGDGSRDFRVIASRQKTINEDVDSWLHFDSGKFLDVDSRWGKITNLRTFKNKLMFWQENAFGELSVNDRSLITDQSGAPLILGDGGLLSRFDYIYTSNGMHEYQHCDALSDRFLYWWDNNKHEICQYEGGQTMNILSKTKYCQNFLNEMYEQGKLNEMPILTFDKTFNELICNVSEGTDLNSGSIVFSEYTDAFVGMFGINPHSKSVFRNKILFYKSDDLRVFRWNTLNNNWVCGLQEEALFPYIKYIVNKQPLYVKTFDNGQIYGRLYGGSSGTSRTFENSNPLDLMSIKFSTPLKQEGTLFGKNIDNTEYNFRFAIPRHLNAELGNRLRGNTMQAELSTTSNSYDFSLQYIATKFRLSWS